LINTVLFDFVNTLAFLSPKREDILRSFAKEQGIALDKKDILKVFINLDEIEPYSSVRIKNLKDKKDFYLKYNERLFKNFDLKHSDKFFDFYMNYNKKWQLYKNVKYVLNELVSEGVQIGIVSNFDSNLENIVKDLGIFEMFNFLCVSQKVGLEKPDINFYKYVKKSYNIVPSSTIYVGDSYSLDYVPSKELGFQSYIIDRHKQFLFVESRLDDIKDILAKVEDSNVT